MNRSRQPETGFGIYIHVPFCLRKCRYCDFYSLPELELKSRYLSAVKKEIADYSDWNIKPRTVFFGGGTPSLLSGEEIGEILFALEKAFDMSEVAEISIECNPGTVSREKLVAYKELGISRISLGVQSLNDEELRFLGRIHSANEALEAIKFAHSAGFSDIGADMIYSLPGQNFDSVKKTADGLIYSGVNHISAYTLIFEPGTPLFDDLRSGRISPLSGETEADLYLQTAEFFSGNGFRQYEISNFSLPRCECLHNLNYWRRGEYFGFGPAAHGFRAGRRYRNIADASEYCRRIESGKSTVAADEKPDKQAAMLETVYLSLRAEGIDFAEFYERYGTDLKELNRDLFLRLLKCGDAESENGIFRLTSRGYAVCDWISRELRLE